MSSRVARLALSLPSLTTTSTWRVWSALLEPSQAAGHRIVERRLTTRGNLVQQCGAKHRRLLSSSTVAGHATRTSSLNASTKTSSSGLLSSANWTAAAIDPLALGRHAGAVVDQQSDRRRSVSGREELQLLWEVVFVDEEVIFLRVRPPARRGDPRPSRESRRDLIVAENVGCSCGGSAASAASPARISVPHVKRRRHGGDMEGSGRGIGPLLSAVTRGAAEGRRPRQATQGPPGRSAGGWRPCAEARCVRHRRSTAAPRRGGRRRVIARLFPDRRVFTGARCPRQVRGLHRIGRGLIGVHRQHGLALPLCQSARLVPSDR